MFSHLDPNFRVWCVQQNRRAVDLQELLSLQTRVDDSRKRVTDALAECDARKR
jgi:hypothetical protein